MKSNSIGTAILSDNYLGALDLILNEVPEIEVEIVNITKEDIFNPGKNCTESKWVASLKPCKKKLILSAKANLRPLIKCFGGDEHAWAGRKFTIFVGEWKGQPCLRVKNPT